MLLSLDLFKFSFTFQAPFKKDITLDEVEFQQSAISHYCSSRRYTLNSIEVREINLH